jgi:hypothetical protein
MVLTRLVRLLKTRATITVPAARAIWRLAEEVSVLTVEDYIIPQVTIMVL